MALLTRKTKINAKLNRFLDLCAEGKHFKDAGVEVGYTEGTSRVYHGRHAPEIHHRAMERLRKHVPGAVKTVIELTDSSKSDATRLQAANRVLDAAGEGVVHKQEVTVRSDADLVQALLDAVGGDKDKAVRVLNEMGVPVPAYLQPQQVH